MRYNGPGSYNGFESQDAFHAWMREEWARMLDTPEKREAHHRAYSYGYGSHAGCDHGNEYCAVSKVVA